MNPSSSLHGLHIVMFQSERREVAGSPVSSTLQTILPVGADEGTYGRWKLAATVLVALPIVLWVLLIIVD